MNWKQLLTYRKTELILTVLIFGILLFLFPRFLSFIEKRPAISLPDPVLILFSPVNLTWFTFGIIYGSLIIAVINFVTRPALLLFALQAYSVMILFRMIVMYVTPFDAPVNLISLNDPFVQLFGSGEVLTKDLFFSGHTATLFLLFLITDKKYLKNIFLICTISLGISVLLQHVHYTVDVIAAPFFAYASYRIVLAVSGRIIKIKSQTEPD
jgi:hypothetical protein